MTDAQSLVERAKLLYIYSTVWSAVSHYYSIINAHVTLPQTSISSEAQKSIWNMEPSHKKSVIYQQRKSRIFEKSKINLLVFSFLNKKLRATRGNSNV